MSEEYNEGSPYSKDLESAKPPKAPSVGKRYAQKKALKYGDTRTAFSMGDVKARDLDDAGYFKRSAKGKRRATKR